MKEEFNSMGFKLFCGSPLQMNMKSVWRQIRLEDAGSRVHKICKIWVEAS